MSQSPFPSMPKASRLHIGLAGRVNVGKSSFLNMLAGQDVAITSALAGTTTDVVEKTMELLPIGPVTLIDTAGVDDTSALSAARIEKTKKALRRADILSIIVAPNAWSTYEDALANEARAASIPVLVVINKSDLQEPTAEFLSLLDVKRLPWISVTPSPAPRILPAVFQGCDSRILPSLFAAPPTLLGDLIPPGGMAVLVVPIDLGAPQGRLIVPQVQSLRDLLDNDASALVVKDREYAATLKRLANRTGSCGVRFPSRGARRCRHAALGSAHHVFHTLCPLQRRSCGSGARRGSSQQPETGRQNPAGRGLLASSAGGRYRPGEDSALASSIRRLRAAKLLTAPATIFRRISRTSAW